MAVQTIQYLKGRFQTGMFPTQQDFEDLFDSCFNAVALAKAGYVRRFDVDSSLASEDGITSNDFKLTTLTAVFIADDATLNGGTWYHAQLEQYQNKASGFLELAPFNSGLLELGQVIICIGNFD